MIHLRRAFPFCFLKKSDSGAIGLADIKDLKQMLHLAFMSANNIGPAGDTSCLSEDGNEYDSEGNVVDDDYNRDLP